MRKDDHDRSNPRTASPTTGGAGGPSEDQPGSHNGRRLPDDTPVLEASLPDEVQRLLGRLLGDEPIETLGDWVTAVRHRTGGGSISVEALCHSETVTPHRGEVGTETYHFRCFYDAVILAALVDEPVDIRTESPDGTVIQATAAGTDHLRVTPADAVFSFGVAESVRPPSGDGSSIADVYAAVCPYVRAFPTLAAYEHWSETVPAATVALPLAGATDVAAGLVE
jgi:hypothetical protein